MNKVKKLPAIRCDPARIQQVLQNVIGNAIKFTEEGQITVDSEVQIEREERERKGRKRGETERRG